MGSTGRSKAFSVKAFAIIIALVLSLCWPSETVAYAVLAHEAIIDSLWDTNIRPLLLKRFPGATPQEIKEAHGYAYGGAIIQGMGYYPHGSLTSRTSLPEFVRKVTAGNPISMGVTAVPFRGRMPVFDYLSEDEVANAYLYLTLYPPQE